MATSKVPQSLLQRRGSGRCDPRSNHHPVDRLNVIIPVWTNSQTAVNKLAPHDHEYLPQVDLREMFEKQPLPIIAPGTVDSASMVGDEATEKALAVVDALNAALVAEDAKSLESLFFPGVVYWKDTLALTYHLRTFSGAAVVAASILETRKLRGIERGIQLEGPAQFVPASPVLVSHLRGCHVKKTEHERKRRN